MVFVITVQAKYPRLAISVIGYSICYVGSDNLRSQRKIRLLFGSSNVYNLFQLGRCGIGSILPVVHGIGGFGFPRPGSAARSNE